MALPKASYCSRVAFTLVELLVAIAVVAILLLLLNELFGEASLTTISSYKQMEANTEARLVFDRMGEDLEGMLRRTDVDFLFVKNTGAVNDGFFIYSQAPAYFVTTDNSLYPSSGGPRSPLSLLGYRINSSYQLERLGKGLTWDNQGTASTATSTSDASYNSIIFLAPSTGTSGGWNPNTLLSGAFPDTVGTPANDYYATEPDYQVIAPDVFRLEICYLLTDGTLSDAPILSTTPAGWASSTSGATFYYSSSSCPLSSNGFPTYDVGSRWYVPGSSTNEPQYFICTSAPSSGSNATWQSLGMKDVSAVIVTMAVLDSSSRKLMGTTSVSNLIGLFPHDGFTTAQPASSAVLPGVAWQAKLNSSSPTFASTAQIPQAAASQIRVYQRFFYLNPEP